MFSSSLATLGRKWTSGAIRHARKVREQQNRAEQRKKEMKKSGPVSIYLKEIIQVAKEEPKN